jgi:hypothetical protein
MDNNFWRFFFVFSAARLPHSSLFWPRKGQTLDNYIRECDLKTRTDVEKVREILLLQNKNVDVFFFFI